MTPAVDAMGGARRGAPSLEASYAAARETVERSGTSFALGMRVLSPARRRSMYAIYAFCRTVDDIADDPGDPASKLAALEVWRRRVDRVFLGRADGPLGPALVDTVERYAPPKSAFLAMIDGMAMDAAADIVAPDWPTLTLYCQRVAGAVGLMSIPVFGARGPVAEQFADTLGRALQLTNILRDVAEDAARGRLYLPAEALRSAGVSIPQGGFAAGTVAGILRHPGLPAACRAVAVEARAAFHTADALLPDLDRRTLRPALVMMGVYDALLRRMVADNAWPRRPSLSKPAKLWAGLRLGLWRPASKGPASKGPAPKRPPPG